MSDEQLNSLILFHFNFYYDTVFPQLGNIMLGHLNVPNSFLTKGDLRDICKTI